MTQLFGPSSNKISTLTLLLFALTIFLLGVSAYAYFQSSYHKSIGIVYEQPTPFNHKQHVNDLGLDCRFCHSAVEKSDTAGMPSTEVCMSCHLEIYKGQTSLEALHKSQNENIPIQWTKVHILPDHVYFNHSVHIKGGVTCVNCHGNVQNMTQVSKQKPLSMKWCLQCHIQHEEQSLEKKEGLTNCSTCHR